MSTYRYYRTTEEGRILKGDWIEADGLEDAERQVRALCQEGAFCEIWEGDARLVRFRCGCQPSNTKPSPRS